VIVERNGTEVVNTLAGLQTDALRSDGMRRRGEQRCWMMIGEELERAGHPKCVIGPVRECCMANGWLGGGGRQSRGAKRRGSNCAEWQQQQQPRHNNTSNTTTTCTLRRIIISSRIT
jgi:hypothetical protein